MREKLSIRAASFRYRISPRTLRFYEEAGVLTSERREGSGYREYLPEQLERLEMILFLRGLGFTIKEIQGLLEGIGDDFREALNRKILDSERKLLEIRESSNLLHKLKDELAAKPPGKLLVSELLSESIYLTAKTERMLIMTENNSTKYMVLIGRDLIVPMTGENNDEKLISNIKSLRSAKQAAGKDLPLIRIRDDETLNPMEAVIIWNGDKVWNTVFSPDDKPDYMVDTVINKLGSL